MTNRFLKNIDMKKSIQYLKPNQALALGYRCIALTLLMVLGQLSYGQDCNTTMACNDGIQISLDTNCVATITPDMILEDPAYENSFYTVTVKLPNGTTLPKADIDESHIGMTLEISVMLNGCNISCWGTATIEDKLPPVVEACEDVTVMCADDLTPGEDVDYPTVNDACGEVTYVGPNDSSEKQPCSSPYAEIITRNWKFYDESGNESECTQRIYIMKADIASITFPLNYDDGVGQLPSFECDDVYKKDENDNPHPDVTGYPDGVECPNIQYTYADINFEICGAAKKVLRQWTVLDWCTGQDTMHNQVIKILDTEAPVCRDHMGIYETISTDPEKCTATYEVPAPEIIDECSDYKYTVRYKIYEEGGDPYTDLIYENIMEHNDTFTITNLPMDTLWIVYRVTDACGNESLCNIVIEVKDMQAPTPVCEGYTVVSLEDQGWADMLAESLDDHSYDNCEIDRFEVKRESSPCGFPEDLEFSEKVNFCCEDVDQGHITVYMRVWDKAGNYNDCKVNVNVQDKIAPVITCPEDITLNCTFDYTDTTYTGVATATDNCSAEVTYRDIKNLNKCNIGTISRVWSARDPQGRVTTCTQRITLRDSVPFNEKDNIRWPTLNEAEGCSADNLTPEDLNSFPEITGADCIDIAISYTDQVFYAVPDYCFKILRTWRVIDWCTADPQNPEYYTYVQKIGVYNNTKPTILTSCVDKTVEADGASCEASIDESILAEDDCTEEALLKYSYTIQNVNDSTYTSRRIGKRITGTYPSGRYKIKWYVEDDCSNVDTCSYILTVADRKAPTPVCISEVTWVLDEDGKTEVWASDFNLKSYDNCEDDVLRYFFNQGGTADVLRFDCSNINNGIAQTIPLRMYVFDSYGNYEYCDVKLHLQDSRANNACEDKDTDGGNVNGRIVSTDDEGLDNFEVKLMNETKAEEVKHMTSEGSFGFEGVSFYDSYKLAPQTNEDVRNGVNTLDLVLIQRHVLGLNKFDDPYKLIAADVNNDKKISASDLLALRKLILGLTKSLTRNTAYRFVPTDHEFEDMDNPYVFPEEVNLGELYDNKENLDFYAIKIGDVNNSFDIGGTNGFRSDETIELMATAADFVKGERVDVVVSSDELQQIIGMQMAIDFDQSKLQFVELSAGLLDMDEDNTSVGESSISLSWNKLDAIEAAHGEGLFTLSFIAKADGSINNLLSLNTEVVDGELYDGKLNTRPIALRTASSMEAAYGNVLYQNTPNPFSTHTTINYELAQAGDVALKVFDITGKVLYNKVEYKGAGAHKVDLDLTDQDLQPGVLYYSLESNNFRQTRNMVVIK